MLLSLKRIALLLVLLLLFNIIFMVIGSSKVQASFWDDVQGGIFTLAKGLVMLWILNLMRENVTNEGEDLITSTIKNGLNLGDLEPVELAETGEDLEAENNLLELLNEYRENNGLQPLLLDSELTRLARMKARDIIENEYFDHYSPVYGTPFEMLKENGVEYALAGENLAQAATIEEAFASLLKSEEHKDNILKARYDKVGIGVWPGGPYGLTIVQLFIDSPSVAE